MTRTGNFGSFAAVCLALCLAAAAHAAAPVSISLKGFTGDSSQAGTQSALATAGLSVFSTAGFNDNGTPGVPGDDTNPAVSFDANGAHFGSLIAGDSGRNYLRTADGDYATVSFTAEITLELANNDQATFFGLGTGDTALFGTPDWSTQFSSASFWPEPGNDKVVAFKTANDVNAFVDRPVAGFDPGVHRLRMTFDAVTGFLVGAIDLNYAGGAFVADATTLPVATRAGAAPLFAADGWPTEPSRIFFGGDDGAVFRDLTVTVVPEPLSAALASLAAAMLVGRRRRRARRTL
jgi:hypothetical protein